MGDKKVVIKFNLELLLKKAKVKKHSLVNMVKNINKDLQGKFIKKSEILMKEKW